jgi:cyclohexyl-isocyanide hydratase
MPLTVGMVLFPRLTQLDLTGAYEIFARIPDCKVEIAAASLDPVECDLGLKLCPTTTFATAPRFDILCVPGGPGVDDVVECAAALDFIAQQGSAARYVTSVCTGALVLGAAGLLHGYRATTHWASLGFLPLFGAIPVSERVVVDRNRITGGGVTAGIDFGLALAALLRGDDVAQAIQLWIEYNPAPPFNSGSPQTAGRDFVAATYEPRRAYFDARRRRMLAAAERYRRRAHGA